MKGVIKNQKKMKNTMYIVFGVFALALFGITMLNPSYAEEGLIIDDALDAIMQGTEMYGSGGFEKVEEEKMIQPVEEDEAEDEDVVEFEITTVEEIEEGEDSQDLEDVDLEGSGEDEKEEIDKTVEDKGQTEEDKGLENRDNNMDEESYRVNNENDGFNIVNFDKLEKNTIQQYEDDEIGQELTSGCFKGKTLGSGKAEITSYDQNICGIDSIVIPDTIEGRIVTAIGDSTFNNKRITSINIPNTVEVIGTGAFQGSNFSDNFTLNLPNNLRRIEAHAFHQANIKNMENLPESLIYIGDHAFSNYGEWTIANTDLNEINNVIIPNSVTYIGKYAFAGNPMENIIIGNSVKEIGDYAFQGHWQRDVTTVTELSIPDSVEKIGISAFSYNNHLKSVSIGSGEGTLTILPYAFSSCNISDFSINKDTLYITTGGFWSYGPSRNPYENVNIKVNNIIQDLTELPLLGTSSSAGYGVITVKLSLSGNAFSGILNRNRWGSNLQIKSVEFPEGVTALDNKLFSNNFYGTGITIPGTIKRIGNEVFYYSRLESVIFEEGVEKIINRAFKSNFNLKSIEFPESLNEIGDEAFLYPNSLENLELPKNLKKIGYRAFESAIVLEKLKLNEGLEEIGEKAFYEVNKDLEPFYIPDTVINIGKNAFCREVYDSNLKKYVLDGTHVTGYISKDIPTEWLSEENDPCIDFVRRYKIDFTGNSNLITYPERQIVDLNEVAADPNTPEIEGYTFGWYKQGENVPYDFSTPITENIVLEARLTKNNYKVTYKDNNGNLIEEKMVEFESKIPTPTPTKQGYIFKGWAGLTENGNMPAHDIVLTANWEEEPSRSSGGGGRKLASDTSEIDKPAETTAEIAIENEHNSATDDEKGTSDTDKPSLNEETSKEVISVTQEIAEDGTEVEVVVEAVAIKNTNIVATVRTETPVNGTNSSSSSSTTHTKEQVDAYSFAKSNGLTTTSSIEEAKMNTELTRIQMAKMLSNFAINVLGQEPDTEKGVVKFDDVTNKMDKQYDNAVTKAYQLGIMGQNVKNNEFRPNDGVTRAEFATALSRLLYNTPEGEYRSTGKYYVPHIAKLYNEGIINKADPKIKEKRGYVMTMLKRTVE